MKIQLARHQSFALWPVLFVGLTAGFLNSEMNAEEPQPPIVGDEASDFDLTGLDGKLVKLSNLTKKGPVVLLVLRGFPGYQCPICNRQVGQFLGAADKLRKANATVVMVYPGPADGLREHAKEFITGKTIPADFHLLIDGDYTFTDAWHLRWNAPQETAYPSTFVVGKDQEIKFAKISKTHGDRSSIDEVLKALERR